MFGVTNINISHGISIFLVSLLLISTTTMVGAVVNDNHDNTGDKKCVECHPDSHQYKNADKNAGQIIGRQTNNVIEKQPAGMQTTTQAMTEVIGNITLITSMGQDWYQQGIYGPNTSANDKSWGWTFFDENPPSNYIIPPKKVTQRNNIYALLLDDGNNSNPISGANIVANVTYWEYDGTTYTSYINSIQLTEDVNRKGFYNGTFYFYGGTKYAMYNMEWCDGCHLSYFGGPDTQTGYFPGNYTVSIKAEAGSKTKIANINFDVTPWGCEDCHGSGNQHRINKNTKIPVDMDSACYLCHGINQLTHDGTDAGNVHQNTAHRNIDCTNCHTNKGINSQTFNGVTFNRGGINNAPIPQYNSEQIKLNGGKHSNLSCVYCHGDLILPSLGGGYNSGGYVINDKINNIDPTFASIQQFQDYYIIDVTGGGPLNINFNWDGTSNLGFYLYPPNFNPKNRSDPLNPNKGDYPYYNGATVSNKPESYTNNTPKLGKWILNPYGYNLNYSYWRGTLQSPINYTIISTYPIEKKNLPLIPECSSCHNSSASGGANTQYEIPNWNPGFAHVDIDNDGNLDIQCRMCHNAMHNIRVKNCKDCHVNPPTDHFVQEPEYDQYTVGQCLQCHGDPHRVTGGGSCIDCHSEDVNISKFGKHANLNTIDGDNTVSDNDCMTCHYNKDMNKNNIYLCDNCHVNNTGIVPVNDQSLLVPELSHGGQTCKSCHAPFKYHMNGIVGPKGFIGLFSFD